MDMDQAAVWLAGSILFALGAVAMVAGIVAINNIIHRYWKPVRIWTADSFAVFQHQPRYATEEELARIAPRLDEKSLPETKK
jgi:hypothetical protein